MAASMAMQGRPLAQMVASRRVQGRTVHRAPFRQLHAAPSQRNVSVAAGGYKVALLFDCDGVIVDTEQLHRRAYCGAFEAFQAQIDGVRLVWDVEYYDILQNTVGGGKPKMKYHFGNHGWPSSVMGPAPATEEARNALVDALQDKKTELYKIIVEEAAAARPGVLALMDEGLANPDVAMAICSAATKEGFEKVVNSVVGPERLAKFDLILAGDDVGRKKPDPLIYNMARERLGVPADKCLVIEDSLVGLRAAQGAHMPCIITPTTSSHNVDFIAEGADALFPDGLAGDTFAVKVMDLFDLESSDPRPAVSIRTATSRHAPVPAVA